VAARAVRLVLSGSPAWLRRQSRFDSEQLDEKLEPMSESATARRCPGPLHSISMSQDAAAVLALLCIIVLPVRFASGAICNILSRFLQLCRKDVVLIRPGLPKAQLYSVLLSTLAARALAPGRARHDISASAAASHVACAGARAGGCSATRMYLKLPKIS
jgi:hypothetical protein